MRRLVRVLIAHGWSIRDIYCLLSKVEKYKVRNAIVAALVEEIVEAEMNAE